MTAKSKNINMRINGELKAKYEDALERAGVSVTDHLTMKILEFILLIDTKLPTQEEKSPQ